MISSCFVNVHTYISNNLMLVYWFLVNYHLGFSSGSLDELHLIDTYMLSGMFKC